MITRDKADSIITSVMNTLGYDAKIVQQETLPYALKDFSPVLNVGVLRSVIECGNQRCRIEIEFRYDVDLVKEES